MKAITELTKQQEAALKNLSEALDKIVEDSRPLDARQLARIYRSGKEVIVKAYARVAPTDHTVRNALASHYLTAKIEEKAWYGRDDNYAPYVYEIIYQRSRSCVALERHGSMNRPRGSGVLIGPNLVLTAAHVVEDAAQANEYDAVFDYEQAWDSDKNQMVSLPAIRCRVVEKVFVGEAPEKDTSPLDYVLLRIEPARPGQERTAIPLTLERVKPETPVVLVGHPDQKSRTIHDNSWIEFPYEVSATEFNEMLIRLNAEQVQAKARDGAAEADRLSNFYEKIKDSTNRRYVNKTSNGAMPTMGAECDTFNGDSGAPTMLRESGRIVGILIGGERDQADPAGNQSRYKPNAYMASWTHHEKILPIVTIVEQLDELRKNWRQEYQVTVFER